MERRLTLTVRDPQGNWGCKRPPSRTRFWSLRRACEKHDFCTAGLRATRRTSRVRLSPKRNAAFVRCGCFAFL